MSSSNDSSVSTESEYEPGQQRHSRRLTSSGVHPMVGVPKPERLVKRAKKKLLADDGATPLRYADLRAFGSCSVGAYDGRAGLQPVFNAANHADTCFMTDTHEQRDGRNTYTLQVYRKSTDDEIEELLSVTVPETKLDIRLFDTDVSIELRDGATCWVMELSRSLVDEEIMLRSKGMLRRIQAYTSDMPKEWFSYRNYNSQLPSKNPASFENGVLTISLSGGYKWRFTGFLTSPEFLEGMDLGNLSLADNGPKAAGTSTSGESSQRVIQVARKKDTGLIKGKLRRSERVKARYQGQELASLQEEEEAAQVETDKRAFIDGLLAVKTTKDGVKRYLVKWTDRTRGRTWEPEESITAVLIKNFEDHGPPTESDETPEPKASKSKGGKKQKKKQSAKGRKAAKPSAPPVNPPISASAPASSLPADKAAFIAQLREEAHQDQTLRIFTYAAVNNAIENMADNLDPDSLADLDAQASKVNQSRIFFAILRLQQNSNLLVPGN